MCQSNECRTRCGQNFVVLALYNVVQHPSQSTYRDADFVCKIFLAMVWRTKIYITLTAYLNLKGKRVEERNFNVTPSIEGVSFFFNEQTLNRNLCM